MIQVSKRFASALLLAVTCAAVPRAAAAQRPASEKEPEVLFPKGARNGGWGGPVLHVTTVRDRAAVLVGARGGWLIDGRLTIGGGGFGLASRIPAPSEVEGPGEDLDLEMGYGGLWLEYAFSPVRLVHLSAGLLIGGGALTLTWHDGGAYGSREDPFFVMEPAVFAELNVAKHVRANLGIAYRTIVGVDMDGVSYSDVAALSAVVAFKFGKF